MLAETYKVIGNDLIMGFSNTHYDPNLVKEFNPLLKTVSLDLAGKAMFDMLAYYNLNSSMSGLVGSIGSILLFADNSFQLQSGQRSHIAAFAQKYLLDDQGAHFLKIMLKCTDATARKYAGKLMKEVVLYLIKLHSSIKEEYRTEKYAAVTEVKACIDNSL